MEFFEVLKAMCLEDQLFFGFVLFLLILCTYLQLKYPDEKPEDPVIKKLDEMLEKISSMEENVNF